MKTEQEIRERADLLLRMMQDPAVRRSSRINWGVAEDALRWVLGENTRMGLQSTVEAQQP